MTSTNIVLPDINGLTGLPLLGPMVGYVDSAAVDVGLPLWLREFAVLALLGVLAYLALRLIVRLIFR
ncbi:MAG: hypothetical protein ACT4NY_28330 [Pseudonocardiales bacterium]